MIRLRKWHVVLLIAAAHLLVCAQYSAAIEKDRTLFEIGLSIGTKTSALVGIRYFVMDNVAVGIDLLGAPVGRLLLGIGADLAYYPDFLSGYAYAATGISCLFGLFEQWQDAVTVPVTTSTLGFTMCIGLNSPTFQMPPAVESENRNDVPTVVYAEVGIGRFLARAMTRNGTSVDLGGAGDSPWVFPDIELGLRQGPFTPTWVQ